MKYRYVNLKIPYINVCFLEISVQSHEDEAGVDEKDSEDDYDDEEDEMDRPSQLDFVQHGPRTKNTEPN